MLKRVAKLLLNEIKKNAPESRIKRIARVLFRLASGGAYKETVKERFINMFSAVKESDLISLIYSYASGHGKFKKVDIDFKEADATKIANIKQALDKSEITVIDIGKLANDLIEKDIGVKNLAVIQAIIAKYTYVEDLMAKTYTTDNGKTIESWKKFIFDGTHHFAHRRYLRDITNKELNLVLDELTIGLSSYQNVMTKSAVREERGVKYKFISSVKKTGTPMNITLIYALESGSLYSQKATVILITAYPEEHSKKPTLQGLPKIEDIELLERSSERKERVEEETGLQKEQLESFSTKQEISLTDITEEEQEWLSNKPTSISPEEKFFVWNPADQMSNTPNLNSMKGWKIKYPESLPYAVGKENVARIIQRIGVELNKFSDFPEGYVSKIQIPCEGCRDIDTGKKTSPFVYVTLKIEYSEPPQPGVIKKFVITGFKISPASSDIDPLAYWELKTRSSIRPTSQKII